MSYYFNVRMWIANQPVCISTVGNHMDGLLNARFNATFIWNSVIQRIAFENHVPVSCVLLYVAKTNGCTNRSLASLVNVLAHNCIYYAAVLFV